MDLLGLDLFRTDSFATFVEKGKHHRKFHPVNHGEAVVQIKRVCFRKGALGFLSLCTEENRAHPGPYSQWKRTWPGHLARLGFQPVAPLCCLQTEREDVMQRGWPSGCAYSPRPKGLQSLSGHVRKK